jgi:hypothetical protein
MLRSERHQQAIFAVVSFWRSIANCGNAVVFKTPSAAPRHHRTF